MVVTQQCMPCTPEVRAALGAGAVLATSGCQLALPAGSQA